MGKKATKTREIILDILMVSEEDSKEKIHILIRDVLDKYDYMEERDKALIKRMAEGTVSRKLQLDYIIDCYAKTKTGKMKPVIRNILRMGVYQILFMDSVPDSAACNEAVLLAVQRGFVGLKGFVNGVLRTVSREKEALPMPKETAAAEYLSVRYSMPEWIVNLWLARYGKEKTEVILRGMDAIPGLTFRMKETLTKEEQEAFLAKVQKEGCEMTKHPYLPYAYEGKIAGSVTNMPGYREGLFSVQDISSMLAVEVAGIKEGDNILDVCAAPGGKTMHAALKAGTKGSVLARDLLPYKVDLIEENKDRLQMESVQVEQWDALVPDEKCKNAFDVVIADLPCSGLGVMGRKADIRYHVTPQQLAELAKLQRDILSVVWEYVKPGGTLLYSTCTINEEENEKNREWFLKHYPFVAVSIEENLPGELQKETGKEGYLQLLPGVHLSDGFFIAKFRKNGE